MRVRAVAMTFALFTAAPVFAQTAVPELHPFGLDPYKPSDAALLRNYGSTLLAQTPLLELRQLDPYKPSHANGARRRSGARESVWRSPRGEAPRVRIECCRVGCL